MRYIDDIDNVDCIVLAVLIDEFKNLTVKQLDEMYAVGFTKENKVLIDIKSMFNSNLMHDNYTYWCL